MRKMVEGHRNTWRRDLPSKHISGTRKLHKFLFASQYRLKVDHGTETSDGHSDCGGVPITLQKKTICSLAKIKFLGAGFERRAYLRRGGSFHFILFQSLAFFSKVDIKIGMLFQSTKLKKPQKGDFANEVH